MARTKQTARSSGYIPSGPHICGCYFNRRDTRVYLPQVQLESHTVINPVCFTTKLTQVFDNPNEDTLPQARYTFPLYDGVAVNGYSISYGEKVIRGVVQQKDEAKKTYQAAVDRGETAGLLESLPAGVFGVTLGNVPARSSITVDITYCGELKHDAAIDGLRYMLPTSIAPRYGDYPSEVLKSNTMARGISITVDVDMAGSAIRKVQSPSHPIAVSMGALSTAVTGSTAPFAPSQASATLTKGDTFLGDDFILQLLVDDITRPQAIIETHPSLPNQRALMTTLVPKFDLEMGTPEIVFIADQSGSMQGDKNASLVQALKVFLKSLPFGVRFNICAFGNQYRFLFPKSQAYNEDNLNTALAYVGTFTANYGGTEILQPITAAFEQHLEEMPLEVMLLTDGEIWSEGNLFRYVNEQVHEKNVDARVFALGIGSDVSHTLVEGVARAGNGFAQFVTQDEDTDQKVMRMLKAALYEHTKDYEIEVHYDDRDRPNVSDEDDYEIVEKVNDCLTITDFLPTGKQPRARATKTRSFFNDDATDVSPPKRPAAGAADRYAHLPTVETPKLLQAPSTIPPLFPYNRTTLYLLLGPSTSQKPVASVTFRATSPHGPLELNIPVYPTTGTHTETPTIHQLAARKATRELEEGRGWLRSATVDGEAVQKKFAGRFDELVERECVRLGERYQVTGRWTLFVAVEAKDGKKEEELPLRVAGGGGMAPRKQLASMAARRYADPLVTESVDARYLSGAPGGLRGGGMVSVPQTPVPFAKHGGDALMATSPAGLFGPTQRDRSMLTTGSPSAYRSAPSHGALSFSSSARARGPSVQAHALPAFATTQPQPPAPERKEELIDYSDEEMGFALFDGPNSTPPSVQAAALAPPPPQTHLNQQQAPVDQATMQQYQREMDSAACMPLPDEDDADVVEEHAAKKQKRSAPPAPPTDDPTKVMYHLISTQTFSGAWRMSPLLLQHLGITVQQVEQHLAEVRDIPVPSGLPEDKTMVEATVLVIAFLETRLPEKKEVWEMVVQKARTWLGRVVGDEDKVEGLVEKTKQLF